MRQDEIPIINHELLSIYSDPSTVPVLFNFLNPKNMKDVRTLAACGIKRTITNIISKLNESDISILKENLFQVFMRETDLDILLILVDSVTPLLPMWSEIFNLVQGLVSSATSSSFYLAMLISSKIFDIVPQYINKEFLEFCFSLISASLQNQTNQRAALELFSSILLYLNNNNFDSSNSKNMSNILFSFFPFFQELLYIKDSDCFNIAHLLKRSIKNIEFDDVSGMLQSLLQLIQNDEICIKNKVPIFLLIDSLLKKKTYIEIFEGYLQLSLCYSASLFDEFCYIENDSNLITFKFVKYFFKSQSLVSIEDLILQQLKSDSANNIFASLLIINAAFPYISSRVDEFIHFIMKCCEAPNHSISELSFSILFNNNFSINEIGKNNNEIKILTAEKINEIITIILKKILLANHFELQTIVLNTLCKLLFEININPYLCEQIANVLIDITFNEKYLLVKDKVMLCYAGVLETNEEEFNIEPFLPKIIPILIENSKNYDTQCKLCRAAAIESLSMYLSKFTSCFDDNLIKQLFNFLISCIECIDCDRQYFISAIFSFINLSGLPIFSKEIGRILPFIIKCIDEYNSSLDYLDESGIDMISLQKQCLRLIRKITKNDLVLPQFLPLIIQPLSKSLIENEPLRKSVMKTISLIYSTYNQTTRSFCELFFEINNANFDAFIYFFTSLFTEISNDTYGTNQIIISSEFIQLLYNKLFVYLVNDFPDKIQIIQLLEVMSKSNDIIAYFPIAQMIDIIKENNFANMPPIVVSNIISIFINFLNQYSIKSDMALIINDIMLFSFNGLQFCIDFLIPPSPIKFISTIISLSLDFSQQSIVQFFPILLGIINNKSCEKRAYYKKTINETVLLLFKIFVVFPNVPFPVEQFCPHIFNLIPICDEVFESINETIYYLTKLQTSAHFVELGKFFIDLFSCLIRFLALAEYEINTIGIDKNSLLSLTKFALDMGRGDKSRINQINNILNNDRKRIMNVQTRLDAYHSKYSATLLNQNKK